MISSIQKELLENLKTALKLGNAESNLSQEALHEAEQQTVVSLAVGDMKVKGPYVVQNIRLIHAHAILGELLEKNGIPYVILKGYASSYYYPIPKMRHMGDVDFFVAPDYYEKTKVLLMESGYECGKKEHERHESFRKNGILYELHSEIKGIPNGKDGILTPNTQLEEVVQRNLKTLIEQRRNVSTEYGSIYIPSEFHHGLIMLLHVAGHMINSSGVGIRHLCDWAVYIDKVNIKKYKEEYESMGLWNFACLLSLTCKKYLDVEFEEETNISDEMIDLLMEDILDAGNFGKKTIGRSGAYMLSKGNFISGIFNFIEDRYPKAKGKRILLPFYGIVLGFNYLKNAISGEKKVNVIKQYRNAKMRKKLYQEFHLFELKD